MYKERNIEYVFLDLDDTVFDFHKCEASALSDMLTELGITPTDELLALYSRINDGQWKRLERGEATREEILFKRFELLFSEIGNGGDPKRAQELYESNLSTRYFYIDGAQELLDTLFGKYKLYLASNGTAKVQDGRISRSGIAKYFDGIFISHKIGYNKPSHEFFDYCFSKIPNFSRDRAIIVGDSLTSDILGGKNAGILTCLFNPSKKANGTDIMPDLEITSLYELPALLLNLNKEKQCTTDTI